jgi:hypothetical protein
MIRTPLIAFSIVCGTILAGCQKDNSATNTKTSSAPAHDHDNEKSMGGHGDEGPFIELGNATVGGWTLNASRDEGKLAAGGESAIDCTVTGGQGNVSAVRFWIGTEDAKGAIKALAAIENPAEASRWHTHVEIPTPFADDHKLWVEVEDSAGAKHVSGFDLKR